MEVRKHVVQILRRTPGRVREQHRVSGRGSVHFEQSTQSRKGVLAGRTQPGSSLDLDAVGQTGQSKYEPNFDHKDGRQLFLNDYDHVQTGCDQDCEQTAKRQASKANGTYPGDYGDGSVLEIVLQRSSVHVRILRTGLLCAFQLHLRAEEQRPGQRNISHRETARTRLDKRISRL